MGTTLTDLISVDGISRVWVVAIEGYQYLLTSHDTPSAVVTAWAGTDWVSCLGGLAVKQDMRTDLDPWDPFKDGGSLTFNVIDQDGTDRFGIDVSRKEGGTSSPLAASKDPDDTTIVVLRSDDFAASGAIYVGSEAIAYTTNTTATETFSSLTRGSWSPFTTESGSRYARSHRINSTIPGVPPQATPATIVRSFPTEWLGKYVAVYLHRVVAGVLDVKAQAHLAFAGRIAQIDDEADGTVTVSCDSVLKTIAEGVVFREPFRARIAEGLYIPSTAHMFADSSRTTTGPVVTTGLANSLAFSAGFYTAAEIQSAINDWLLSEYAAPRLLFRATFDLYRITADGTRSMVGVTDGTAGNAIREFRMTTDYGPLAQFMGIQTQGTLGGETNGTGLTQFYYSTETPLRVLALGNIGAGTQAQVSYEQAAGSFVDQSLFIPNVLDQAAFTKGVLRIGQGYYVCDTPDGDSVNIQRLEVLDRLAGLDGEPPRSWLTYDDPGDIEIQQIILAQSTFRALVMSMLTSTGATGFNDSNWDVWPEQLGLAIPHSILSTLDAQLAVAPEANKIMTIPIDKPTRFVDLWNVDFILRHLSLIWRQEKLTLTGFATPTSEASLSLGADDKAAATDAVDGLRIVARTGDKWMRNSITIKHGRTLFSGEYTQTPVVIDDKASQNAYGTKAITLEGRNFIAGGGILGQDLFALLPSFAAGLPFITRPSLTCMIPVSFNLFETHTAGEAVLLTDTFARDPTSGERGLTGKPSLVVSSHFDHGGAQHGNPPTMRPPSGTLEVMLFPGRTLARYSPAGQLDDTASAGGFAAGYNNGTSTIRLYANKYTDAVDPSVDASYFPAGAKIEITEIDPADPAAPLQWSRTVQSQSGNDIVMTATLAAPAFDSTKVYLVRPQTYSSATATQQLKTFQADDADQRIEDLRDPFAYAFFGAGQLDEYQAWSSSELAERYAATAFGDGKALDTAYAHGSARNLNILRDLKCAPQCPQVYSESRGYTSGTWDLVHVELVFIGRGTYGTFTRPINLSPIIHSTDGNTANVRVTLARHAPMGTALADVTRVAPYRTSTFTTTSTTDVIPTSVAFATHHLKLADNAMHGLGWLYVEVNSKAVFKGFAEQVVGAFS